ncbi:hypothetical protein LguiA_023501 [Lonicera macranthoides]
MRGLLRLLHNFALKYENLLIEIVFVSNGLNPQRIFPKFLQEFSRWWQVVEVVHVLTVERNSSLCTGVSSGLLVFDISDWG